MATERQKRLIHTAIRLFAQKGYEATSVAEIARTAGVSEGGLFRHFPTKERLLATIFHHTRQLFFVYLEDGFRFDPQEEGLSMILRLITQYCRFYEDHEVEFDCINRNNPFLMPDIGDECRNEMQRIHNRMIEQLRIGLTLGVNDGSIRPVEIDPVANLILSLIWGSVRMRLYTKIHLKDLETHLLDFARNGLATDS